VVGWSRGGVVVGTGCGGGGGGGGGGWGGVGGGWEGCCEIFLISCFLSTYKFMSLYYFRLSLGSE